MKLSIQIPDEWSKLLREQAARAGYRSVQDLVADTLATVLKVEAPPRKSWGGLRKGLVKPAPQDEQVPHVPQVEHDEEPVSSNPPVKVPSSVVSKATAKSSSMLASSALPMDQFLKRQEDLKAKRAELDAKPRENGKE